jgi:dTDP-4-amino-4,6-dideoxygalactose transaminase
MKVPIASPVMTEKMIEAASNALRNERLTLGESVFKFEESFARMVGSRYAISVSSGTAALQLALQANGVKAGDRTITSPMSFVASSNSFVAFGGLPGFADVSESDYNLDPAKLGTAIDDRTKAVMPVHLYGQPARMDDINDIARKRKLTVIEDACQAHGARYKGKVAGNLADAGCFSFYPTKNMHVGGDGGMITTNDEKVADLCQRMRHCGRAKGSNYLHDVIGYTYRLNSANAAVGLEQLKMLPEWNEKRRAAARQYDSKLKGVGDIVIPPQPSKDIEPVYHLYTLRSRRRYELKAFLESKGVGVGLNYEIPIHLQPAYKQAFGYNEGAYPVAERLCKEVIAIPMFADITAEQINYVVECIKEFYG